MVSTTAGVVNEQLGDEWAECTILGTFSHFEPPNALLLRLDHICSDSFLDSQPE